MSVQNSFAVVLGHRLTRGARVKLSRLAHRSAWPLLPTKRAVLRGANTSGGCAASCDDETGVPTRRSTAGRRLERVGVHASTLKQPRDQ
jgi:hypothetical protein